MKFITKKSEIKRYKVKSNFKIKIFENDSQNHYGNNLITFIKKTNLLLQYIINCRNKVFKNKISKSKPITDEIKGINKPYYRILY